MSLNDYFDKIYVLNLKHRVDRRLNTVDKLKRFGIEAEIFQAYDGRLIKPLWKSHRIQYGNDYFKNPNYLACAISHIAMYKSAIDSNYNRILILEDDNAFNYKLNEWWNYFTDYLPGKDYWDNLLYLGWIPLSDDQNYWNYNVIYDKMINNHLYKAHNLWGLFAYGIHINLMRELVEVYETQSYPMELDRYFVTHIQPRGNSYAVTPQLFAATDGYSDNSDNYESGMITRSVDKKWAKDEEYI